jgi:NHL repeat/Bacterial Ig-like domain/RTX calcium-binding nonapeptide repeat (4 copies)
VGVESFRPRTAVGDPLTASGVARTRRRVVGRALLAPLVLAAFLSAPAGSASASIAFDLTWGSVGTGNGQFTLPTRVATDSSGVYVSDTGSHRIQKFNSSGGFSAKWGATFLGLPVAGTGNGEFNSPQGIATDSSSNFYVADTTNDRIQKFSSTGTYTTQWGGVGTGNGQFSLPQGIATDSLNNVYVADTGNNRIQKFSSTGTYMTQWGGAGTANGQFASPSGVAVDSSGNVYVADSGNNRIQKFDSSGTFLAKWGTAGTGNGQFGASTTLDVATGSHDNVIVADTGNNRIQKFRPIGTFITTWGTPGTGSSQFNGPSGVAVDSSHAVDSFDYVYVVDRANNRIQKFHETDTTSPDTTILTGPSGTSSANVSFTFSSTESPLLSPQGFECSLDAAEWASCGSPKAYSSLSDGSSHTFRVRAVDAAGNPDPSPDSRSFTVDATPPDTTLDSGPSDPTNDATPTFGFSSEPGASFQCRFDSGSFGACSGPGNTHTPASALADGSHTFYVRAMDAVGNPDPSPDSQTFTVDTVAPNTGIASGPTDPTMDSTPTFGFNASEGGSTFECRFDSDAFAPCSGPGATHTPSTPLADGSHTFEVQATDPAGNTDPSPGSQSFTVDTVAPDTTITGGPSGTTNDPTPTFTFSASQAGSTFRCKVNSSPFAACSSPKTTFHLSDGSGAFYVRATDPAGNVDPTPAARSFTVRTAAVHVSGSTLVVTAAVGGHDNFAIARPSPSVLRVTDFPFGGYAGSGVHAWAGCTRVGDYTANCSAAGITLIQVASLGWDDRVVNSTAIPSSLDGGALDDVLVGGSSDDTLTGGAGTDLMKGMDGNDQLLARDGEDDTTINCDGGSTPGTADEAVLDPLPKDPDSAVTNCETKTRN